jgi:hypothetical protein
MNELGLKKHSSWFINWALLDESGETIKGVKYIDWTELTKIIIGDHREKTRLLQEARERRNNSGVRYSETIISESNGHGTQLKLPLAFALEVLALIDESSHLEIRAPLSFELLLQNYDVKE